MKFKQERTCAFFILQFAAVSSVTHYCDNGNTVTITNETSGSIRTVVSGTNHYGNNLNCAWIIDGGSNKIIQLTINSVNLQLAPTYVTCGGYDHLSIIDGNSAADSVITSICGERNPYEVISSGQYVYLKFSSNDKNFYDHSGVSLTFNVFDKNECPPGWNNMTTTDQCFRIKKSPSSGIDWFSAFRNCLFSQANLAVIDDNDVFEKLYDQAQSLSVSSAWIGLTDIGTEGVLKWLNNEKLESLVKTDGNIDENDCGIFDFSIKLFGVRDCKNDKHLLICQRNRDRKTVPYDIPEEEEQKNTEVVSLRWQIILGIGGGVLVILIVFFLYCKFCKGKRTIPSSLSGNTVSRSARYTAAEPEHRLSTQENNNRYQDRRQYNIGSPTSPPSYSESTRNTLNTVQFSPQINVNVTVNQNGDTSDRPPSYSFHAPTA